MITWYSMTRPHDYLVLCDLDSWYLVLRDLASWLPGTPPWLGLMITWCSGTLPHDYLILCDLDSWSWYSVTWPHDYLVLSDLTSWLPGTLWFGLMITWYSMTWTHDYLILRDLASWLPGTPWLGLTGGAGKAWVWPRLVLPHVTSHKQSLNWQKHENCLRIFINKNGFPIKWP